MFLLNNKIEDNKNTTVITTTLYSLIFVTHELYRLIFLTLKWLIGRLHFANSIDNSYNNDNNNYYLSSYTIFIIRNSVNIVCALR